MVDHGNKKPNAKKQFLIDLSNFMSQWRRNGKENKVVLMADMNECISSKGLLHDSYINNGLIDTIGVVNPEFIMDKTYLY